MWIPIVVLAALSVLGGMLNVGLSSFSHVLDNFLAPVFGNIPEPRAETSVEVKLAVASAVVALIGIATAGLVARVRQAMASNTRTKGVGPSLVHRPALFAHFEKPGRWIATFSAFFFDNKVVDGAVNVSAKAVGVTGTGLRRLQSGYLRSYALSIASGTMLILIWAVYRSAA